MVVFTSVVTTVGVVALDSECSSEAPVKSSCRAGVLAGKPDSPSTPSFFGGNSPPPPPPSPIYENFRISSFFQRTQKISFFYLPPKKIHTVEEKKKREIPQISSTTHTKSRSESLRSAKIKNSKQMRRLLKLKRDFEFDPRVYRERKG